MLHGLRQNSFPTPHAMAHRGSQTADVGVYDRVKTVLAGPAQLRDPLRIEVLDVQGTIAVGTLVDGDKMKDPLHPTRDVRVAVGFDMRGESVPLHPRLVNQPAYRRSREGHY